MKLINIRPVGRYRHRLTGKEVNIKAGRIKDRSVDIYFFLRRGKRVVVPDKYFFDVYEKVEPKRKPISLDVLVRAKIKSATEMLRGMQVFCEEAAEELQPYFNHPISIEWQPSDGFVVYFEYGSSGCTVNLPIEDVLTHIAKDANHYKEEYSKTL